MRDVRWELNPHNSLPRARRMILPSAFVIPSPDPQAHAPVDNLVPNHDRLSRQDASLAPQEAVTR